jgi:diaminopimelate epimerase
MEITFYKYQGAGNDFVIIDDRAEEFDRSNTALVAKICNRRFGVGADGLMLLRNKEGFDFEMVYYNSDGNEGSMCGNGGRCIVSFAKTIGVVGDKCCFLAVDGPHEAEMIDYDGNSWVSLKMIDVPDIEKGIGYVYMNTGSPHYVTFNSNNLDNMDLVDQAREIRYNGRFSKEGTNVNFIDIYDDVLKIRTYERGVEDETLACGTGVTAAVLTAHITGNFNGNELLVKAKGGDLKVLFERVGNGYENVWLQGPAEFVFKGLVNE